MKVFFECSSALFDCKLQVWDRQGMHEVYLFPTEDDNVESRRIEFEIDGDSIEIALIPQPVSRERCSVDWKTNTWKDRFLKKALDKIFDVCYNVFLLVGCRYRIGGLVEGDWIFLKNRELLLCPPLLYEIFDFFPVLIFYFELQETGQRSELVSALTLNRAAVIQKSKKLALANFGIGLIFSYPINISVVKHLTKDKRINRKIRKLYNLPYEEREKWFDKLQKKIST